MRILVLGLDQKILDKTSAVFQRALEYADLVDRYVVIVPSKDRQQIKQGKLEVYGSGGSTKPSQLFYLDRWAEKIMDGDQFEVISVQDIYFLARVGVRLKYRFQVGLEVQVHGIEKMNWWRRRLAASNLVHADSVRVVGGALRQQLIDQFGIDDSLIVQVPIYFDWQEWKNKPFTGKLRQEKWQNDFVFLVVARLAPVKQIDEVIRSFAQLVYEGKSARLVIVGQGREEGKLRALAHELGLDEKVEFVGWQDDLVEYYRSADCFVQNSKIEGYGLALLEALACRLPVITTPTGVAQTVVKDGVNGLLVKDSEDLARMMKLVVVNRQMLAKFKSNTRNFLDKLPTRADILAKYQESWRKAKMRAQAQFHKLG